jgi:hypothetical protein
VVVSVPTDRRTSSGKPEATVAKRECMNVKIDADLVRDAKVVAAVRRITLTDYLSQLLRELIAGDLARVAAGLTVEGKAAPSQPEHSSRPPIVQMVKPL